MVGMILCFSVVARINTACAGGSSSVLRNALKACWDNMCTSSMIYTLYFPAWGIILTLSIRFRMSSTELLEAASSSWILNERDSLNVLHESHWLHGSASVPMRVQLMVLAKIRAHVVFPTPLGPQKR